MARPERHDVDYFPFYVKDGKTLFVLESKFGCKGIGFFTNVMRFLCKTPDHHFCIADEQDRLYFFAAVKCDENEGQEMLNIMATTRKIHTDLWRNYQVISSPDLLNSLSDAYKNRKNNIVKIDEILVSYQNKGITSPQNVITSTDNTQTKLKETKLKETKDADAFVLPSWIPEETWNAYLKLREKKKAAKTDYALNLIIKELNKIHTEHGHDRLAVLNKSIKSGWTDVYPLKEGGDNGNQKFNAGKRIYSQGRELSPEAAESADAITREYLAKKKLAAASGSPKDTGGNSR